MIADADATIRRLLERELGDDAGVTFAAPTKEWAAAAGSKALVDVHLFDVREETSLRRTAYEAVSSGPEGAIVRKPPPRSFRLSYLVSALATEPEMEHDLLSRVLTSFMRYDALPVEELTGRLAESPLPIPVTIGVPAGEDPHLAQVWRAVGGEMRGALVLAMLVPVEVEREVEAGPPVIERRVRMRRGVVRELHVALSTPPPRPGVPGATPGLAPAAAVPAPGGAPTPGAPVPAASPDAGTPESPPPPPIVEELLYPPEPDAPPRRLEGGDEKNGEDAAAR